MMRCFLLVVVVGLKVDFPEQRFEFQSRSEYFFLWNEAHSARTLCCLGQFPKA